MYAAPFPYAVGIRDVEYLSAALSVCGHYGIVHAAGRVRGHPPGAVKLQGSRVRDAVLCRDAVGIRDVEDLDAALSRHNCVRPAAGRIDGHPPGAVKLQGGRVRDAVLCRDAARIRDVEYLNAVIVVCCHHGIRPAAGRIYGHPPGAVKLQGGRVPDAAPCRDAVGIRDVEYLNAVLQVGRHHGVCPAAGRVRGHRIRTGKHGGTGVRDAAPCRDAVGIRDVEYQNLVRGY